MTGSWQRCVHGRRSLLNAFGVRSSRQQRGIGSSASKSSVPWRPGTTHLTVMWICWFTSNRAHHCSISPCSPMKSKGSSGFRSMRSRRIQLAPRCRESGKRRFRCDSRKPAQRSACGTGAVHLSRETVRFRPDGGSATAPTPDRHGAAFRLCRENCGPRCCRVRRPSGRHPATRRRNYSDSTGGDRVATTRVLSVCLSNCSLECLTCGQESNLS